MVKKDGSMPKKGMNRNVHPSELTQEQYSFALNVNFQDEHGNGTIILQNEPSNIKCTGFTEGYKVIGHKFDINDDRTYFFLTNPTTGCSEIGYIDSLTNLNGLEQVEAQCQCNISVVLENPLEGIVQESVCPYYVLITDCEGECGRCLNFSIDHPIKENNIHIKDEVSGKVLYWTDFYNPQRYLQLDRLDIYFQDVDDCTGIVTPTCLQCNKMRIFPLFNKPCLQPKSLDNGGNLRAGMYEALVAYSTFEGDAISNYYSMTNPIPIFDKTNNILDQTLLDYQTNQSIALELFDLDQAYEYYTIAIIYRSGLDGAARYFSYGTYPIDNTKVTIATLQDKDSLALQDLLIRKPFYELSKGISVSNGYLFHYGLKAHRDINLQPIANLMGGLIKWNTVQAHETLYENSINVSKYTAFMRDEVYPLSIKVVFDGGYETSNFTFIARPPLANEIEELDAVGSTFVTNTSTESILEYAPECSDNLRNKRWQFENTGTVIDRCLVESSAYEEVEEVRVEEATCEIIDLDTVVSGTLVVDAPYGLVSYINQNSAAIIASTDPAWADIKDVLEDPTDYPETCTPEFSNNCSETLTLVSEEMYAISAATEVATEVAASFTDYERVKPPLTCAGTKVDVNGDPIVDTAFSSAYMRPGEVVYEKSSTPSNNTCSGAQTLLPYLGTPSPLGHYMLNDGSLGSLTPLQTSLPSTSILFTGFTGFLHTNAIWFKLDFAGRTEAIVEISTIFCNFTDDNTGDSLRVSLYDSCSAAGDISSYLTHISDVTLANDTNKFITLTASDFSSGIAYIAIDSPIISESEYQIDLSGSSGDVNILIGANVYYLAYDGIGLTTTADNFVTTHAAAIKTLLDIDVTSIGDIIYFRGLEQYYAVTSIVNLTGDLNGVRTEIETYHTLTPPCGCFGIYDRTVETTTEISFTDLVFGKKQTYSSECTFTVPKLYGCDPVPYEYGLFSYWESILKYPCNGELYDSSTLLIKPTDIPIDYQNEFEDYYVSGGSAAPLLDADGNYVLVNADFRDQPIRHYKFPDSTVTPFMSHANQNPGDYKQSVIYPIGFRVDSEVINAFLDIAVNNGLLTIEERSRATKYEIYRGDRRTEKSIVAKGLLYDVYKYEDTISDEDVYYPNYPLNCLGEDEFNEVSHPYNSTKNDKFTFHSPDIHHYKPSLTRELSIEGYQFGKSENYFDEVDDHAAFTILGDRAYNTATALGTAEMLFELMLQSSEWSVLSGTAGVSLPVAIGLAAVAIGLVTVSSIYKIGQYRYQWLQTFHNLGKPNNFAYFQASVGFYNNFLPNSTVANTLRGVPSSTYLKEGRWTIADETINDFINFNNVDREDSVYLGLGASTYAVNYPLTYINYDNQSTNAFSASRRRYNGTGKSPKFKGNAASPYGAIKQYLPEQYGNINSIDWVNTGYCGDVNVASACAPIFGGDVYISRFSLKRKLPFFTSTAHGLAPNIPFAYSEYFNINPYDPTTNVDSITRYFINYKMNIDVDNTPIASFIFPSDRSHYNLDAGGNDINEFYVKPPNKFYLYSYGVPYFLVESIYNCNFRYAKREQHENFYPNVKDVIDWTQESNVTIKEPNTYFYNDVYSLAHTKSPWRILPTNFNAELWERLTDLTNTTIYSRQDVSESSLTDPWLTYRALDAYQFPSSYGTLIDMDGIESEQVLARFTNGFAMFGSIDVLADRLTIENKNLGAGGIFAGRSIAFNKTELGYAGTQHTTKVSTEFGNTWVDAKRGKVFNLLPNAKGLEDLTEGLEKWFKENLPFKILNYYPNVDVDNNYKGIGLSMGWDDRLKRIFLTKLDCTPISENICFNGTSFFKTDGYETVIADQVALGYTYNGIEDCKLKFTPIESGAIVHIDLTQIYTTNSMYFKDCSWTVAYSPMTKTWISYYSFKPNYYINYHNYFQTGLNFPEDSSEFGLWSHLSFLSSYQVFYGKLYPFTVEYPISTKMTNSVLHSIDYWLDVRKYYNKYDFADVYGVGFNKAVVYNNQQNSGYLNLVPQEKNNMPQMMQYPKHNSDNIEVLQTELQGKWSFNYLYNLIRDEKSGLPIWSANCSQTEKILDNRLLDYRSNYKDRLRGDYFLVRMTQDAESRFKLLFRFATETRDYYEQ